MGAAHGQRCVESIHGYGGQPRLLRGGVLNLPPAAPAAYAREPENQPLPRTDHPTSRSPSSSSTYPHLLRVAALLPLRISGWMQVRASTTPLFSPLFSLSLSRARIASLARQVRSSASPPGAHRYLAKRLPETVWRQAAPERRTKRRTRSYTECVDRVRFGRALGYGTRHAAKTIAAAVNAAAAPSSASGTQPRSVPPLPSAGDPAQNAPSSQKPPTVRSAYSPGSTKARSVNLRQGAHHLRRSFWQPLAVFTGALWSRVTGLFFALLAVTMGSGAWRTRGALHSGAGRLAVGHFVLFGSFTLLFGYFAVSSFVRARLKERKGAAAEVVTAPRRNSAQRNSA